MPNLHGDRVTEGAGGPRSVLRSGGGGGGVNSRSDDDVMETNSNVENR